MHVDHSTGIPSRDGHRHESQVAGEDDEVDVMRREQCVESGAVIGEDSGLDAGRARLGERADLRTV